VDEVVPRGYLILIVSLIEVFVKHLDESFLGVQLSLIVLGVYIDLIAQFFCFGYAHNLPPVSQEFLFVKVHYLMLTFDLGSQDIFLHFS
jgi:hypothetical protein